MPFSEFAGRKNSKEKHRNTMAKAEAFNTGELASALDDLGAARKSIRDDPREQPEHGEITSVPGFDGPLPSK